MTRSLQDDCVFLYDLRKGLYKDCPVLMRKEIAGLSYRMLPHTL